MSPLSSGGQKPKPRYQEGWVSSLLLLLVTTVLNVPCLVTVSPQLLLHVALSIVPVGVSVHFVRILHDLIFTPAKTLYSK